jgi:hypothetical protein
MKVAFYAESFGGAHGMEPAWINFIDTWEVENYRRKVAAGASAGRVEGKTIVVTGAAQGFGEGIARELMGQGANIVVADLNEIIHSNPGKTQLFFQLRDSRGINHVLLRSKTCGVDVRHTLIDYIEKVDGLDYHIN